MRTALFSLLTLSLFACVPPEGDLPDELRDDDGDGFVGSEDCNDDDPAISPSAPERCNSIDDNCDGNVDESGIDASTWYADEDGDGFGGQASTTACAAPNGFVDNADDCDDGSADVKPGGTEVCNGADDDCNGVRDDDASDARTFYGDADGDGYGSDDTTKSGCTAPRGYVEFGGDCNDARATVSPGADEVCDSIDNNCDGTVDEDSAVNARTWHADADGDGYGDATSSVTKCARPTGYVDNSRDCNDGAATTNPLAPEVCDSADNDCDGTTDEDAADAPTWYKDVDGDGFGVGSLKVKSCSAVAGYVADAGDCDDASADDFPGADEYCNGDDDDCDGTVDEDDSLDASTWYHDRDGDGFGDPSATRTACKVPVNYLADNSDCDDRAKATYPGADEYCDKVDTNCDGVVDPDDALDVSTFYPDVDGDKYGDAAGAARVTCYLPSGYVLADNTDCDDTDKRRNPGSPEICRDGVDNNCNDSADSCGVEGEIIAGEGPFVTIDPVGYAGRSVVAGDFDGDGLTDVGFGDYYYGSGRGLLGVLISDKDGDGKSDLVDGKSLSVDKGGFTIEGSGTGYSTTEYMGYSAAVLDFNGDGYDDFVGASYYYYPPYDGTYHYYYGAVSMTYGHAAKDSDGDGKPDWANRRLTENDVDIVGTWRYVSGTAYYGEYFGFSADGGDLNGDGYDDLVVGAYQGRGATRTSTAYGRLYIFNGRPAFKGRITADDATASLYAVNSGDYLGYYKEGVGSADLDGDGYEELLGGTYGYDYTSAGASASSCGAVWIVYGDSVGLVGDARVDTVADASVHGSASSEYVGWAVSEAGDVDGDGYHDAIVGAYYKGGGSGESYVIAGSASRMSGKSAASAQAYVITGVGTGYSGYSVTGGFDINADGADDVAVGAYYSYGPDGECCGYGRVDVLWGPLDTDYDVPDDADVTVYGTTSYMYLGDTVKGAGDVNGDGYGDLAFAGYSSSGRSFILLGSGL